MIRIMKQSKQSPRLKSWNLMETNILTCSTKHGAWSQNLCVSFSALWPSLLCFVCPAIAWMPAKHRLRQDLVAGTCRTLGYPSVDCKQTHRSHPSYLSRHSRPPLHLRRHRRKHLLRSHLKCLDQGAKPKFVWNFNSSKSDAF